ncbi:G-type lectin S-receptor-like serine/threonine-protein kinase CES101 [Hevea brasiliensis]|uniref:G-type lectin S-receptor-like serine/threonine-protein kinase CES101 n=1 Tax=Hevea brasiliensis TaxID=3981 RepID=UPI0025F5A56F|nr:G-type lectin S-receptor-like serine/threonine-protein kinase CES101 [Hevea brasiliensis]
MSDRPSDADELKMYSVSSIKAATNSFSLENKLGEGGFGPVYKGELADSQEIAVKRLLQRSGQGLMEFKNVLILIARLQHMNLVRLLGFCIQGEERLLIYETYQSKRVLLDWRKRFGFIEGIAQGLLYLHKYSRLRIIHRNLKTSNILLDKDMNPKISDFGMARIFKANESETNTNRIVGNCNDYMALEYAMEGIFSIKSDVYSFGVLMLEIISGKRSHNIYHYDRPLNLVGYAWELWKEDALEILDPTMSDSAPRDQVLRCINVALLCVEHSPFDRPNMAEVLSMLSNEVQQLPMPKQPAFYVGTTTTNATMASTSGERGGQTYSANGLSLTDMAGR